MNNATEEQKEINNQEEEDLSHFTEVLYLIFIPSFTFILLSIKKIFSWGSDEEGQMGLGENKRNTTFCFPRICSFSIVIHQLSCGVDHTAFVAKNGYLYTMGSNALGKLGLGQQSLQNSFQPQLVNALSKYKVIQVSCGHSHTCAIIDSGELFAWGDSSEVIREHLSYQSQIFQSKSFECDSSQPNKQTFRVFELRKNTELGIQRITKGQLGINSNGSFYLPQLVNFSDIKAQSVFITDISCGYYHTAVVLRNGTVCTFGSGKKGQLGIVKCGQYHTLFLDESGRVYSTGLNDEGQLGLGHKDGNLSSPKQILELEHTFVKKIYAGSHSAAISDSNEVYFFGKSYLGEFLYPQLIRIGQEQIKEISIGNNFGMALSFDGRIYSWGVNEQGQLGQGDSDVRIMPSVIETLLEKRVQSISCGENYVICLGQLCDQQSKLAKTLSQKKAQSRSQSPISNNQNNPERKDNHQITPSKSQSTNKKGLIKSQSQLLMANQCNLQNELQKQVDEKELQFNDIYLKGGFKNKMRNSRSFHSPSIGAGSGLLISNHQFSPDRSQYVDLEKLQDITPQIINQKEVKDKIAHKNIQDRLQNNSQFETSQKKLNPSDSIAELSTKDGIKQSPSIFFENKNNTYDFSKQLPSSQDNRYQGTSVQESQQINIDLQSFQDRQQLLDQIMNLERQISNKNEFIIKLQSENQLLKDQNHTSRFQNDIPTEREQQLKREKCDLLIENARFQEENTQLLNVLQQQADQISDLMKENKEINIKLKHQTHQHEIQNKQVNQKLIAYSDKIQDLERVYSDVNSMKSEIQIKDERLQILEDQTIYLKRQIEIQQKSMMNHTNNHDTFSKYSSILESALPSQRNLKNTNTPLTLDMTNYESMRNKSQQPLDQSTYRNGFNKSGIFNTNQINENQNPFMNKSQINDKYSQLNLPNEDLSCSSRYTSRSNLMQTMTPTPQSIQSSYISQKPFNNQFTNFQSTNQRNPSYNQIEQTDNLYPYQQKSILKNSPLKVQMGSESRIYDDQAKHNVSFTDLDSMNISQNPSFTSNIQAQNNQNKQNQANKAKSFSVYQPDMMERKPSVQVNPNYMGNKSPIGNNLNEQHNTPISTKFAQTPQQQFSQYQYQPNLLSFPEPGTTNSKASKQLDFLNYSKQIQQNSSLGDQEFQKSLTRTKQQLESRINHLNRKLSSKNMY